MDFEALYFRCFAAMADAVDALDENRPAKARDILISAQQQAEEAYINDSPETQKDDSL